MAKFSQLMACLSEATRVPESEIKQIGRRAREGGFIAQGARGNAAPDVGVRDAANLLIAFMWANFAKDAPEAIVRYRSLKRGYRHDDGRITKVNYAVFSRGNIKPKVLSWFEREHDFGAALEFLIEKAADGAFDRKAPSATSSPFDGRDPKEIEMMFADYEFGNMSFAIEVNKTTDVARIAFYDAECPKRVVCAYVEYNGRHTDASFSNVVRVDGDVFLKIGKLLRT
ncbi:hypothetical protein [Azospirillum tabaci]|uniref:hypothetical protein n=1 Tax=Azospirillum tabaci TaxID=2752310 RepID=UPI001660B5B9|nr:hypothetical protein [Azospirillum tabaci]